MRLGRIHPLFLALLLICLVPTPHLLNAQAFNRLAIDWHGTSYFGAENIITMRSMLTRGEDNMLKPSPLGRAKTWQRLLNFGYRGTKLLLFDLQVNYMLVLAQHEIYGHGARFRMLGATDAAYTLHFLPPFGPGGGSAEAKFGTPRIFGGDERSSVAFSGNEGNTVLANLYEPRFLLNDQIGYQDAMIHLLSRHNLSQYVFVEWLQENYGNGFSGDLSYWVQQVNRQFGTPTKSYDMDRLMVQNLTSFLNPLQFYSAYTIGWQYLVKGRSKMRHLPGIKLLGGKYMPMSAFNLTPFGSEFIIDQYWVRDRRGVQLQARIGDPLLNKFWGAGFTIHNLLAHKGFYLSPSLHMWQQPSLELSTPYSLETTKGGLGGLVKLDLTYFPLKVANRPGIFFQFGYKTDGYFIGEQLPNRWIVRGGVALGRN